VPKYRFTVEVDTIDELLGQLELLAATARSTIAQRDGPGVAPGSFGGTATVLPIVGKCPQGHGDMRLIPAGTAKSGPRIGQPYPAFYKCDKCGSRQELTP
jgi:hypothetical protein